MTHIYPGSAIEHGEVPQPGAHLDAGSTLLASFESLMLGDPGQFAGAEVYGSTGVALVNPDAPPPRPESDVDWIVRYHQVPSDDDEERVEGILVAVRQRTHVAIDFHSLTTPEVEALEGSVPRDALMNRHLVWLAGDRRTTVGDPTAGLKTIDQYDRGARPVVAFELMTRYLRQKADYFAEARIRGESPNALSELGRSLELVSAVGRKLLELMLLAEYPTDAELVTLSGRDNIEGRLRRLIDEHPRDRRWQAAGRLIDLRHAYSGELASAMVGNTPVPDYEQWLAGHHQIAVDDAWKFTQAVLRLVLDDYIEFAA